MSHTVRAASQRISKKERNSLDFLSNESSFISTTDKTHRAPPGSWIVDSFYDGDRLPLPFVLPKQEP